MVLLKSSVRMESLYLSQHSKEMENKKVFVSPHRPLPPLNLSLCCWADIWVWYQGRKKKVAGEKWSTCSTAALTLLLSFASLTKKKCRECAQSQRESFDSHLEWCSSVSPMKEDLLHQKLPNLIFFFFQKSSDSSYHPVQDNRRLCERESNNFKKGRRDEWGRCRTASREILPEAAHPKSKKKEQL